MSYEKVKTIKIEDNKVLINSACNNVRPLTYSYFEFKSLSKILQEKGREALDIEILKIYEDGSFQQGKNKYIKALNVLRYVFGEEYKRFNWRNHNAKYGTPEREEEENLRKSEEFKDLFKKALNYKSPKGKFIITKNHSGEVIYAKVCPTCIKWSRLKEKATKFNFEEEAKDHIYNEFKDIWKVEDLDKTETKQEEILRELDNFHGTEHYYKSTFGKLKLTDGINYLRNKVNCFWLIDIVESVQHLKKIKENSEFLLWKIEVKDNKFIVNVKTDTNELILYEQEGDYTDFPLKDFEFYQINDVVLLKGEY